MDSVIPRRLGFISLFLTFVVMALMVVNSWLTTQSLRKALEKDIPTIELAGVVILLHEKIHNSIEISLGYSKQSLDEYDEFFQSYQENFEELIENIEDAEIKSLAFQAKKEMEAKRSDLVEAFKKKSSKKSIRKKYKAYIDTEREFRKVMAEISFDLSIQREEGLKQQTKGSLYSSIASAVVFFIIFAVWLQVLSMINKNEDRRKEAELNLEEERARNSQAAKMTALGEMAGGVAHEINNPLSIISGSASVIQREMKAEIPRVDTINSMAEKIEKTVDRIAKIVRGLKSFSRDDSTDPPRLVKVSEVVQDTLVFIQNKLNMHAVRLKYDESSFDVEILCKPTQLSQVLLNMISNAVDAIQEQEMSWIELKLKNHSSHIEIIITDSGNGIPKEVKDKILLPFFTTKPVGKGTGLGLSISRTIINNHRGKIDIDSSCKNTRFIISLPKNYEELQKAS